MSIISAMSHENKAKFFHIKPSVSYGIVDNPHIEETVCCYGTQGEKKLVWQITDKCLLSCPYCFTPKKAWRELSGKTAAQLIKQLVRLYPNKKRILFAGREPLLFPKIESVIEYATSYSLKCSLSTSGELLAREKVSFLKAAGIMNVNVSINSIEPKMHNKSRPGGDLARVILGIGTCMDAGLPVKVNVTLTKRTLPYLRQTLEALCEMEIKRISIGFLHNISDANYEQSIDKDELIDMVRKLVFEMIPPDIHLRLVLPLQNQPCYSDFRCPAHRGMVAILPDGSITHCNIYPYI